MATVNQKIDEIVVRLRECGMRVTPQRMAVLNTLIGNKEHLSAEAIYDRVRVDYPMIGLATVYKTVSMLKEMGEITELNFDNDCALYDGSGESPHPHFICTQCGSIIDIDDADLEALPSEVAQKIGYEISNYRLDFFGICPNCRQNKTKRSK
jgi:Fur family peroxide stress response transcriptional regulator